jgi:hypothetical protein
MTPEIERLLQGTTRRTTTSKNNKGKKTIREERDLAKEAANTLKWLKENPYWTQMTETMMPNEWAEATNKLLSEHREMKTLQEVLLWLDFP